MSICLGTYGCNWLCVPQGHLQSKLNKLCFGCKGELNKQSLQLGRSVLEQLDSVHCDYIHVHLSWLYAAWSVSLEGLICLSAALSDSDSHGADQDPVGLSVAMFQLDTTVHAEQQLAQIPLLHLIWLLLHNPVFVWSLQSCIHAGRLIIHLLLWTLANVLSIMLHFELLNDILLLESIFSSWMVLASQICWDQAAGTDCHLQLLVQLLARAASYLLVRVWSVTCCR